MASNLYCSFDRFAVTLDGYLNEVYMKMQSKNKVIVREACRIARKEVRAKWGDHGYHKNAPKYAKGFTYTTRIKSKEFAVGEVGNKTYPGLVHLLEKGHARVGGGRVEGIPHVAPAADKAFVQYEKLAMKAIEEAIK